MLHAFSCLKLWLVIIKAKCREQLLWRTEIPCDKRSPHMPLTAMSRIILRFALCLAVRLSVCTHANQMTEESNRNKECFVCSEQSFKQVIYQPPGWNVLKNQIIRCQKCKLINSLPWGKTTDVVSSGTLSGVGENHIAMTGMYAVCFRLMQVRVYYVV